MGLYALALVLIPFVVGAFALIMDRVERAIVNPPADTATNPAVASLPAAPLPTESASPTAGTSAPSASSVPSAETPAAESTTPLPQSNRQTEGESLFPPICGAFHSTATEYSGKTVLCAKLCVVVQVEKRLHVDEDILARAGIFQGMDAASISALLKDLVPETFRKGDTIIREGEPGDKLYIIVEGKLKLSRTAPDGRENLLAILGPSDMFGELSIFDPAPRTSSAICVTDVRTYTMDRAALRRWLDAQPQIAEQLLRVLARRLRRTNNSLADLIFTDVPGRVAKALLQLAQRFGSQEGNTVRVNHDLTQEEIAQLVGASRETVNKALAEFAHRGWIRLEGKSVVICESEHLARRAR
mgnify:CR=1 FL=1